MILLLFCLRIDGKIRFPLVGQEPITDLNPGLIKVGKDGMIYVADRHHYHIYIFSDRGQYLSRCGQKGEGPGDFKRWFGEFTIAPDGNIFQVDYWSGNQRITVFSARGRLLKTIPIRLKVNNFGTERIFVQEGGSLVMVVSRDFLHERAGQLFFLGSNLMVYLMGPEGNPRIELIRTRDFKEFSTEPIGGGRPVPFGPEFIFDCSSRGILACQKTNEDQVQFLNLNTGKKKKVSNGFKKRKISPQEFRAEINNWLKHPFRRRDEALYKKLSRYGRGIDAYRPIIDRIRFDPEGNLLVASFDREKRIFSVNLISVQGQRLRSFTCTRMPAVITPDKVYFLDFEPEEDLYYIEIQFREKSPFFRFQSSPSGNRKKNHSG
jgi:hypothetical protein